MRILIPGAAGFIGFHLAQRLLDEGHEVVGLDNFASGLPANIDELSRHGGFRFVEHDLTRPLPDLGALDQIYNMACPASPVDFERIPLEILYVSAHGVRHLLELAQRHGARLLHTSTSEVYGDPQVHPQPESYWGHVNPIGPRAVYDEGKRYAEALLTAFARVHGVTVRIVRIFNTYGPRMRADDGRALPTFITQALTGEPLTVHGDGSQTRSFCYIDDQVDGLITLMNSAVEGPVNIGNDEEISMLDTAREVVRLTGSASEIIHTRGNHDDPKVRRPDLTRARELLGWQPRISRADGFAQTVAWFRRAR